MRQPPEKLDTGCVELVCLEAQAEEQRLGARAHGIGVGVAERARAARPCACRHWRLRRAAGSASSCAQRRVAVDRVFDRRPLERRRLLRDVRDAPVRREIDVALVGVQLAAQQREQARFARAVGADQADALAGVEGDVGAFEQRLGAAPQGDA